MNNRNLFRQLSLLAALGCCVAWNAGAQDLESDFDFAKPLGQTTRFGIVPFYGYRFGGEVQDSVSDKEYSFKDSPGYGLMLDYAPLDYFGRFELLWSRQDSSLDFEGNYGLGEVDLTVDVIQLGGVAEFGTEGFRQYVSAHVGATHYSIEGSDDDTKLSFSLGVGVKAYLTKNIYLRAELTGFCTVVDAEGGFIYANGIAIARFTGDTLWQGQISAALGITF